MKLSALILVITILFLAIKPGINVISLQNNPEQTCCEGQCSSLVSPEKSSEQEEQEDGCEGKSCNPFQVCCSHVLQCIANPNNEVLKPETFTKQFFSYKSTFYYQFAPDFWHPPKIV